MVVGGSTVMGSCSRRRRVRLGCGRRHGRDYRRCRHNSRGYRPRADPGDGGAARGRSRSGGTNSPRSGASGNTRNGGST